MWKQERVENRLKELYGLEAQPEDNDDDDELPPMTPPTHDDVQDPYDEEQAHSNALASRFFVRIANDRVEVRKLALSNAFGPWPPTPPLHSVSASFTRCPGLL